MVSHFFIKFSLLFGSKRLSPVSLSSQFLLYDVYFVQFWRLEELVPTKNGNLCKMVPPSAWSSTPRSYVWSDLAIRYWRIRKTRRRQKIPSKCSKSITLYACLCNVRCPSAMQYFPSRFSRNLDFEHWTATCACDRAGPKFPNVPRVHYRNLCRKSTNVHI